MNESDNETDEFFTGHPANLVLAIVSGIVGAGGMIGNLFLLILIASDYKNRKSYEWLVFALALGDFLLCLNQLALQSWISVKADPWECKVSGGLEYIFGIMSFLTPPLVAYNRYLSLYDEPRCNRLFTNRNVVIIWSAILTVVVLSLSPFIAVGSPGKDDTGICSVRLLNRLVAGCLMAVIVVLFMSYALLITFSYKVVVKIRDHKKKATGPQARIQSKVMRKSQELITTMLIISAMPMLAQVPGVSVRLIHIFLPPINPWISRLAITPFPITSAANGYITMYVIKQYRNTILKLFKKGPAGPESNTVTVKANQRPAAGKRDGKMVWTV